MRFSVSSKIPQKSGGNYASFWHFGSGKTTERNLGITKPRPIGVYRFAHMPSNCKRIGHFSIENHRFSGAILHHLCTFNRRFRKMMPFRKHQVPFAEHWADAHITQAASHTVARVGIPCTTLTCSVCNGAVICVSHY